VDGWTLNSRADSAAVFLPELTRWTISFYCVGVSLGGRPPIRPSSRATNKPLRVRSRNMARSNLVNDPTICIIMRPAGEVVSTASVRLRNPAPVFSTLSMRANTSLS
jgi:hypothetical protein